MGVVASNKKNTKQGNVTLKSILHVGGYSRIGSLSFNLIDFLSLSGLFILCSTKISRRFSAKKVYAKRKEYTIFRSVEYKDKNWLREKSKSANNNLSKIIY